MMPASFLWMGAVMSGTTFGSCLGTPWVTGTAIRWSSTPPITPVLRKYDSTALAGSCGNLVQPVFVMQAGENRSHDDSRILGNRMTIGLNLCFRRTPIGDSWAQAGMRTSPVVVKRPAFENLADVIF